MSESTFFLIFFIKSSLIFFYKKTKRYSSECVLKEAHLCVPIRGFKLRGFLQSLHERVFQLCNVWREIKCLKIISSGMPVPSASYCHISAISHLFKSIINHLTFPLGLLIVVNLPSRQVKVMQANEHVKAGNIFH